MMRRHLILGCLVATLSLSACHRKAEDPMAVTSDEQRQLNDAAATLDANAAPINDTDAVTDSNTEDPS